MSNNGNTIAGWILGAGIAALGLSIFFGEVFHVENPKEGKQGYAIEGVESSDGAAEAEIPLANVLAEADASKGEGIFKKCVACHTIASGGADGIGPNLQSIMGKPIAGGGFAYSDALKGVGGTWTFEAMDSWLKSPKKFATGNKMTFAGLGKPEDRAALLLYLNSQGSNLPLPAPVEIAEAAPEGEAADETAVAAEGETADAETAATEETAK